jgi:hypothetical protein
MSRNYRHEHPAEWVRFFAGLAFALVLAAGFWFLVYAVTRALT